MSEDEFIKFEVTDYDLENEFNPRSRKAKKEHQIYGVWAKDSDDDENEDVVRRRTRKPKDFSAPIGFVAGGVQQAGKKKEPKEDRIVEKKESTARMDVDSSSEEDRPATPDESETAGIRRKGQGMRSNPPLSGNMGNWEKHTKGIGAKLLLQMGYQPGKGLGKDLQGISAPVEATLRKGRGAIGAYGPEKSAQKAKKEEEKRAKEKEEAEPEKSYHWKKSHKGRYFYKDAADVIQEGKPTLQTLSSNELSRVPVIDMTGKEKRVLSGYHALRAAAPRFEHEPRRQCKNFAAPELTHNLNLMVECCEQDIIQNARELQRAEDEIVAVQKDLQDCDKKLEEQDKIIDTMEGICKMVQMLNLSNLSLMSAHEILTQLKTSYALEYEMFGIGNIAATIISPMISSLLADWDPLEKPDQPVEVFLKWRDLLSPQAYNSLLWQHFVPQIKKAAEAWNPRMPDGMVRAISVWTVAMPDWLLKECIKGCVVPRMLTAVQGWDPTTDTQPVHTWVLPWHQLAGETLATSVYPLIRSRLATALAAWHPCDASARPLLGAWREAWGPALTALLHQHIVPRLEHCLHQAPIELVGRDNTAWLWCVEWVELMGAASVAAIAGRALLPRWLAALAAWLNTNPTHATVLHSYTNFKKMFSEEMMKEPVVRDAFRKALDMMNRSADLEMVEPPPPPRYKPEPIEDSRIAEVLGSINQQKSFSELLEAKCAERGISLVPMAGRTREGRPLYKIGEALQCYVIRNVIMYSNDSGRTFVPISIEKLLQIAETQ